MTAQAVDAIREQTYVLARSHQWDVRVPEPLPRPGVVTPTGSLADFNALIEG